MHWHPARQVNSREEMAAVLEQGSLMRATAATGMNRHSSRSHAVFTITLEQRRQASATHSSSPLWLWKFALYGTCLRGW